MYFEIDRTMCDRMEFRGQGRCPELHWAALNGSAQSAQEHRMERCTNLKVGGALCCHLHLSSCQRGADRLEVLFRHSIPTGYESDTEVKQHVSKISLFLANSTGSRAD